MTCVVVALGGNALAPPERPEDGSHRGAGGVDPVRLERAADALVGLAREYALVVTHGNGPQVGWLAEQSGEEGGRSGAEEATLDVIGAETEGMLGYLLERTFRSRLPGRPVVSLLTQVVVDGDDPAFERPTKPIGSVVGEREARSLGHRHGWTFQERASGWRRVVASPRPRQILELEAIDLLLSAGHVVICGGGGGIPVTVDADGTVTGVEAVIDKDRTSALLAQSIEAEALLFLTDVPGVIHDWPEGDRPLREISVGEVRGMGLMEGSMGPKAEAAADFVERTGGVACIGAIEDAVAILRGEKGTRIVPG